MMKKKMNYKKVILFGTTFIVVMIIFNLMFSETVSGSIKTIKKGSLHNFQDSPFGFLDVPPDKFDYYSDLGIKWLEIARENERLGWGSVEKEKGVYDFSAHDADICKFYQNGINVIYITRPINSLYGTSWIEGVPEATDEYPDGNLDAWANYVKAVVERYDGDGIDDAPCTTKIIIKYYQFVHELNPFDKYWNDHREQYAEVFEITYKAMKQACEDCILSMPVPHLSDLKEKNNFLSDVLSYLEGKNIHDIGFDYHRWSMDSSKPQPDKWKSRGQDYEEHIEYIELISQIASRYGFDNSNIISLESGMGATEEMEPDQAGYVIRAYIASIANGQKKLLWTKTVEYGHHTSDDIIWAHTGLIHNPQNADGLSHKKLSYYTYKLMVEKLEGSDWDNIVTIVDGTDNVYVYKFVRKDTGKSVYVAWWDWFDETGNSKTITIDVGNINSVKITEAVPDAESGADLDENDYPHFFNIETKAANNGEITITLVKNPVFIEEIESKQIRPRR
jgi:hypothetical protein